MEDSETARPDVVTYYTLLGVYLRLPYDSVVKLNCVRRTLDSMERRGKAWDIHMYAVVLKLFVRQPQESRRVFRTMLKQGVKPLKTHWDWLRHALQGFSKSTTDFDGFCTELNVQPPARAL
jgi:hypothetical protein